MKFSLLKSVSRRIGTILVVSFCVFNLPPAALAYVPSDPMYLDQPYLKQINVEEAWDVAKGDGVVVAVLDSGVDIDHQDIKFNIWSNSGEVAGDGVDNDGNGFVDDVNGWDFVEKTSDPRPKFGAGYTAFGMHHGTAIAGLIAAVANNGKGITGLAPNAKIMPLRVLTSDGTGNVSTLIEAMEYAVNNGADIINLSLVGDTYSSHLEEALSWAGEEGVLVVAAAGNASNPARRLDLDKTPTYPACYGNNTDRNVVLAVSSVNAGDVLPSFASYGSCVDLIAPGEGLLSLSFVTTTVSGFEKPYAYTWTGTSASAALVSGAAALVKSDNKSLLPFQIISVLLAGAKNVDDLNAGFEDKIGSGRLDVGQAIKKISLISKGYIAKLAEHSAVYYIDAGGYRHLFANEMTYWSWYNGRWADQGVKIISADDFNNLKIGRNITARPGSRLIRFENSPKIYAVLPGGLIKDFVSENDVAALYGADWRQRVIVIQIAFEQDYIRDYLSKLSADSKHPSGSLIQYRDSSVIWYIDGNLKREVSSAGFIANQFKNESIIVGVSPNVDYSAGQMINGFESGIFIYNK